MDILRDAKSKGCARNEIEKELLLNRAKKRLKKLQPTLFDFLEDKDEREEILGKRVDNINIENDLVVSIGGELIFKKLLKI